MLSNTVRESYLYKGISSFIAKNNKILNFLELNVQFVTVFISIANEEKRFIEILGETNGKLGNESWFPVSM